MALVYGSENGSVYATWYDDGKGDWDSEGGGVRVGNGQCWDGVDSYNEINIRRRKQEELDKYRNR